MTEETWLICKDPQGQVDYLFTQASPRKLRLWACACGREVIPHFEHPMISDVLDRFESVADGDKSREDQQAPFSRLQWAVEKEEAPGFSRAVAGIAHSQWIEMVEGYEGHFALGLLHLASAQADSASPMAVWEGPTGPPAEPKWRSAYSAAQQRQSAIARDIFGNPFQAVMCDRSWLTSAVLAIARRVYDDRAFDQLTSLADALQDAGCYSTEILAHCRSSGPHVRGCWVIDLVLGKQ